MGRLLTPDEALERSRRLIQQRGAEEMALYVPEETRNEQRRKQIVESEAEQFRKWTDKQAGVVRGQNELASKPKQEAPGEPATLPEDWRDLHWKTRVKLAEDLSGEDLTTADEADAVLEGIENGRD